MILLLGCAHPESPAPDSRAGPSPVFVLAGGGEEGEATDPDAWSASLYGALLENGDVTGDGAITVAVLSTSTETDWIPAYFEWLGADDAYNLRVASRAAAEAVDFSTVDAVFLKGGDQGEYYDLWNDTALEDAIRGVAERGGGVGGTSAGAMSQSAWALAGGQDYVSADVLADACTPWLDDTDGGSSIHSDFLGFLPDALVDTHFSVRGRLGRLAGAMAKAIAEGAPADLLGVGIDEQTGLVVRGDRAEVVGVGSVAFVRGGDETAVRECGFPLVWAGLTVDRLTAGSAYDFETRAVTAPPDAWPLAAEAVDAGSGDWSVTGARRADEERFGRVVERYPDAYAVRDGTEPPLLGGAVGLLDAHDPDMRGVNDEVAFRVLADEPGTVVFLVADGGTLERAEGGTVVNPGGGVATLVLDAAGASWGASSAEASSADAGDGALHAAGIDGVKLHILDAAVDGRGLDPSGRAVGP